jgi:TetR/AcrR family transcriptional repressor of lmrAB and yxaGH operons
MIAASLAREGVPDADSLATVILAAVEGALLLARTRRDVAPLRQVAAHLNTLIQKEPPCASTT